RTDWEILMELAARVGRGWKGAARNAIVRAARPLLHPERVADVALRLGPYGRRRSPMALDMKKVRSAPHGIDLGPLEPNLANLLRTENERVRLAPSAMLAEVGRLNELLAGRESAR